MPEQSKLIARIVASDLDDGTNDEQASLGGVGIECKRRKKQPRPAKYWHVMDARFRAPLFDGGT